MSRHQPIDASPWSRIRENYVGASRLALDELATLEPPITRGKLLLWHGPPGCGKTNALRALAHEWREWCALHLVTDPDVLLNHGANYLTDVLMASDHGIRKGREWKLVVLEDTGELFPADAQARLGQGLSRILNASDGLLGMESKTLFLVTTNEPLGRLHPAVHRPGRCLAEVEFGPFCVEQSNSWLDARETDERVSAAKSLAELFAIANGEGLGNGHRAKRPIGFAA